MNGGCGSVPGDPSIEAYAQAEATVLRSVQARLNGSNGATLEQAQNAPLSKIHQQIYGTAMAEHKNPDEYQQQVDARARQILDGSCR
jgi:hypothetical protein